MPTLTVNTNVPLNQAWLREQGLSEAVWLPFILIAGCPEGPIRKNVLAQGGVCVLIHHVNTN